MKHWLRSQITDSLLEELFIHIFTFPCYFLDFYAFELLWYMSDDCKIFIRANEFHVFRALSIQLLNSSKFHAILYPNQLPWVVLIVLDFFCNYWPINSSVKLLSKAKFRFQYGMEFYIFHSQLKFILNNSNL